MAPLHPINNESSYHRPRYKRKCESLNCDSESEDVEPGLPPIPPLPGLP